VARGPWKDADTDAQRERKAQRDAENAVTTYAGTCYSPDPSTPPSMEHHGPYPTDSMNCDTQLQAARAEIMQLKREIVAKDQTIATLRERVARADARRDIARNRKLGSASAVASVLPDVLGSMKPQAPGTETPFRVPLGRLADETGLKSSACSRQLKRIASYELDGAPLLRVETKTIPQSVNEDTGEIVGQHKEIFVGTDLNPRALADILAVLDPDNAPKHGGKPDRNVCPNHPTAGVLRRERTLRRVVHECAQCRDVLSAETVPVGRERVGTLDYIGADAPIDHDGAYPDDAEPNHPGPMHDHGATTNNHTGGELSTMMVHRPPPTVADPPSPDAAMPKHDSPPDRRDAFSQHWMWT
jgi:flagellar motility protein MotE (MotC chaperone)